MLRGALASLALAALLGCSPRGSLRDDARENTLAQSSWPAAIRTHPPLLSGAQLFEGFQSPARSAHPWIRWWWCGPTRAADVEASLDALAAAGFGGVEINTLSRLGFAPPRAAYPTWLSEAWLDGVAGAARAARARGLGVDLLLGAGWPFAAAGLPAERALRVVELVTQRGTGPAELDLSALEFGLLSASTPGPAAEDEGRRELLEVWLDPLFSGATQAENGAPTTWIRLAESDGHYRASVPEGPYALHALVSRPSPEVVKHPVPGAVGTLLDPFHPSATSEYLARIERAFEAAGLELSTLFRAAFVDSFEHGYANWTPDLREQFERRRGYALGPYLAAILLQPTESSADVDTPQRDTLRRVRQDYWRTLHELFRERTLQPIAQWCRAQGLESRLQAHGHPWAHGLNDGYLEAGMPEGETWIFQRGDRQKGGRDGAQAELRNLLAASAAHARGERRVTCETATNVLGILRTSLLDVEQAAQLSFLSGATSLVMHGSSLSPSREGFPGRLVFGTWFQPDNPWWPHLDEWTARCARIQHVLQATRPATQIALVVSAADVWASGPPTEQALAQTPDWLPWLWQAARSAGYAVDAIDAAALDQALVEDGRLVVGQARYELLALCSVESLDPARALRLAELTEAGGGLLLLGAEPRRATGRAGPGEHATQDADRAVRAALARAKRSARARNTTPPSLPRNASAAEICGTLASWFDAELRASGLEPLLDLDSSSGSLGCVAQRSADGGEVYLLANLDRQRSVSAQLRLDAGGARGQAWVWRPDTGAREPLALGASAQPSRARRATLELGPLESAFLVFDRESSPLAAKDSASKLRRRALAGPWSIELRGSDGSHEQLAGAGIDALLLDPRPNFAGQVVYSATADTLAGQAELVVRDVLGSVELVWDGVSHGVRFSSQPRFALGLIEAGAHTVELRIATTPFNRALAEAEHSPLLRGITRSRSMRQRAAQPQAIGLGPGAIVWLDVR